MEGSSPGVRRLFHMGQRRSPERPSVSQAYHPQANCKAKVAGQQLIVVLHKLHAEEEIKWVEALPRALLYIYDQVGEGFCKIF
jgi:hypothetical protein